MKKVIFNLTIGIFALSTLLFNACNPEEHDHNEQEIITKVTITFKDGAGKESAFVWNDPDGENGSQKPTIDNVNLSANSTYTATVRIENATVSPAINITEEVQKESNDHLFVYSYDKSNLTIDVTDKDNNGKPLGIATKIVTKNTGDGKLRIVLKHLPTDKNNTQNPGGETDVDVEFPVSVK
jgi:hypothetical protein